VVLNGESTNLHAVWDTAVVEALGDDPGTVAAVLERQITAGDKRQWSQGSVVDWANQSFQIAKTKIYPMLPGTGGTDAPIVCRLIMPGTRPTLPAPRSSGPVSGWLYC